MYRIELAPGEETVFRTIEELAIGVRNGLVTPRARIYHNASQKWLPIEFHPHYKKALGLEPIRPGLPAGRSPERAEPLSFATPPRVAPADAPTRAALVAPLAAAPVAAMAAPVAPAVAARVAAMAAPVAPVAATWVAAWVDAPNCEATAAVEAEAEEAALDDDAPHRVSLPPGVASPVLHLPTISYPMIAPVEKPVAHRSRGATRSHRPLHLAGAVVALSLAAYAIASAFSPARGEAVPAPAAADRPTLPPLDSATATPPAADRVMPADAGAPAPGRAPRPAPAPAPAPAPVAMTQPASSGFAPALEPRAIVSTPSARTGTTASPKAATAARDSSIAPAPIDVDLAVPALPVADSLGPAPRQQGDSAMRRILRVLSGGNDIPERP